MAQTNPKLLVEIAKLRVQRAQRYLDRQREAVAALERAGQDATTAKRLLRISERALATHAADQDRLTNGAVARRGEESFNIVRTMRRRSQNLTHWSVSWGRESPPTSRGLNRFHG
jgi:hypothetical protein